MKKQKSFIAIFNVIIITGRVTTEQKIQIIKKYKVDITEHN